MADEKKFVSAMNTTKDKKSDIAKYNVLIHLL